MEQFRIPFAVFIISIGAFSILAIPVTSIDGARNPVIYFALGISMLYFGWKIIRSSRGSHASSIKGVQADSSDPSSRAENWLPDFSYPGVITVRELIRLLPSIPNPAPATAIQREAIEELGMGSVPSDITEEHANAILSARDYVHCAIEQLPDAPFGVPSQILSAELIAFIIADDLLRNCVLAWSGRRLAASSVSRYPPRDKCWRRVVAEASRIIRTLEVPGRSDQTRPG